MFSIVVGKTLKRITVFDLDASVHPQHYVHAPFQTVIVIQQKQLNIEDMSGFLNKGEHFSDFKNSTYRQKMGSHEPIFTNFAPDGPQVKLFWNFESDLVKVNSKTPFGPPKGAKWGQSGPNPIFCPIIAIFAGKGPFWKF